MQIAIVCLFVRNEKEVDKDQTRDSCACQKLLKLKGMRKNSSDIKQTSDVVSSSQPRKAHLLNKREETNNFRMLSALKCKCLGNAAKFPDQQ